MAQNRSHWQIHTRKQERHHNERKENLPVHPDRCRQTLDQEDASQIGLAGEIAWPGISEIRQRHQAQNYKQRRRCSWESAQSRAPASASTILAIPLDHSFGE